MSRRNRAINKKAFVAAVRNENPSESESRTKTRYMIEIIVIFIVLLIAWFIAIA